MAYTRTRGITSLAHTSGLDTVDIELIEEFPTGEDITINRVDIQVDFQMTNTSGSWPTMPTVPGVFAIGTTTSSGTPAKPANGPITDDTLWKWWWDGIIWQPNYIAVSGTSVFDWHNDFSIRANHALIGTENTSLWAGIEVIDNNGSGGSFFAEWFAIVYWSILFSPTKT